MPQRPARLFIPALACCLSMASLPGCELVPGSLLGLSGPGAAAAKKQVGSLSLSLRLSAGQHLQYVQDDVATVSVSLQKGVTSLSRAVSRNDLVDGAVNLEFADIEAGGWTIGAIAQASNSLTIGGSENLYVVVAENAVTRSTLQIRLNPVIEFIDPAPDLPVVVVPTSLNLAMSVLNSQTYVSPYAGIVRTLAGNGQGDFQGAWLGTFTDPEGLAVDASGSMYVADTVNHVIRVVTRSGVVTDLAGGNSVALPPAGSVDGTGTAARFNGPRGVVLDDAGNLFVADTNNNSIRKVTPQGVVSTEYGIPAPLSIARDGAGNLYVGNATSIYKIAPAGGPEVLAGADEMSPGAGWSDGSGTNARFNGVRGIAADVDGTLYVTDRGNHRIRKVTPEGIVTTLAGSGTATRVDGVGVGATFNNPWSIALTTSGWLVVGDYGGLRLVDRNGQVATFIERGSSSYPDGDRSVARVGVVTALAGDSAGRLFALDWNVDALRLIR